MSGNQWMQYLVLTRNWLHTIDDPITRHDQQLELKIECRQRLDDHPNAELARLARTNRRPSTNPELFSLLDFAVRVMSGYIPHPPTDPVDLIPQAPMLHWPGFGPQPASPLVVGQCHSVLAGLLHDRYRVLLEQMKAGTKSGRDPHDQIRPAVELLIRAANHALKAANVQFISRAVAMVGMDLRDVARELDVDLVSRDARYVALWSAVETFQMHANLQEIHIMCDEPADGLFAPACALPTCPGNLRKRRQAEIRLIRCMDECPDALHVTYCGIDCASKDYERHLMFANGWYHRKPADVLVNDEARRIMVDFLQLK